MGCNCGGRSGGRATGTGAKGTVWRHTDPHGGRVDYADPTRAETARKARGGKVEQIDPRTGAIVIPATAKGV
ncbi:MULTISPECIES: hypothetical protein [Streptomycetaceae]|uniref:hypothetical protein n=1 Tax=Streptomycetaceae TaxID=2062 RepID=UPI00037FC39D|nr:MULTISPECIES: hypothetical protein [Streptomycetaceae]